MNNNDCAYCAEGENLDKFGIKIKETPFSKIILFREQSHPGRLIVASKQHVDEIWQLSDAERTGFTADIAAAAKALHKAYAPQKINYGAYGDTMHHLHFHLVPKYQDAFEWGTVFAMNPGLVALTEAEYAAMAERILAVW